MVASAIRVTANSSQRHTQQIRRETERRLAYFIAYPEEIPDRLRELDEEWDIERMVETQASIATTVGLVLGNLYRRRFLLIPVLVQSMLLTHAIQGFYPLLPIFRRVGFRTRMEIAAERYALMAIRGDFEKLKDAASGVERGRMAGDIAKSTLSSSGTFTSR